MDMKMAGALRAAGPRPARDADGGAPARRRRARRARRPLAPADIGRAACVLAAVYLAAASALSALGSPDAALAIPDPVTGIEYGEGLYSGPADFGLGADDPVGALLMAPFVALANVLTGISITLVKGTASTSILTAQFDQIAPSLLGIVREAHRTVVIPVANVVASVVFVVGLVKLLANSSASESFIDTWKLMMVFICYGGAIVVINASWEIMVALYTVALRLVSGTAALMPQVADHNTAVEGVANGGVAIGVVVMAFLMVIVCAVCCLLVNAMILVRGLEIYLYTCYSPIAFAFMVTEGGRQQVESFLKRYVALLLAGAIQMLLMVVFAMAASVVGSVGDMTDSTNAVEWLCRYVASFVWVVVIAFMMTRSTSIARDLIGVS